MLPVTDPPPELVLFDLDGTLTDSADGVVASFRHALDELGAAVPDGDLVSRIVGPPMHITMRGLVGERADDAMTAYRSDYTTRGWAMNRMFDGVPELLADLKAAGVRTGNRPVDLLAGAQGLAEVFPATRTSR